MLSSARFAALLFPWVALLAFVASCGGGGEDPAPGDQDQELTGGGDGPLPAPPDPSARPPKPASNFHTRFKPFGDWFPALIDRITPSSKSDPWPTEIVANRARREIRGALLATLSGEKLSAQAGHPDFSATKGLRPERLRTLDVLGGLLREGEPAPLPSGDPRGSSFQALLSDLLRPHSEGGEVEVWITSSWQEGPRFTARGRLRISSPGLQTNLDFESQWLFDKVLNLVGFEGLKFEEASMDGGFEELTAHVMGEPAWLSEGSLERSTSTDGMIAFTDVYLAMHALAIGDLDGDGLEDVYVGRQGGEPNQLLQHQPDGTVKDVAAEAGLDFLDDTGGILICDLDGDGGRDVVVTFGADIVICWNDGSGKFAARTLLARQAPHRDKVYTVSAGDIDGDGDLDLYDTRYFSGNYAAGGGMPVPYEDARNGAPNSLWVNEGERGFREATTEFGFAVGNDRFSLVALFEDLDGDQDLDVYVVNDFGKNNAYLRGDDGKYTDQAGSLGLADKAAGMGITCADANGDGELDLYITNMFSAAGSRVTSTEKFHGLQGAVSLDYRRHCRGNTLLFGRGDGRFADVTESAGVGPAGWAWGALFGDFDLDGLPDLYVPNGFVTGRDRRDLQGFFWRQVVAASPQQPPTDERYSNAWRAITRLSQDGHYSWNGWERNGVFWNVGEGRFLDASRVTGGGVMDDTRVGATCDWDGDGRVDLWLKNRTAPLVRFLHNRIQTTGHFLTLELAQEGPNTEAIGALVKVHAGGRVYSKRVYAGEGYLGNPSKRLHFGLGRNETAVEVEVHWPDGQRVSYAAPALDAGYRLTRGGEFEELPKSGSLHGAPAKWREKTPGTPGTRTVMAERLPLSNLRLPNFDGSETTVGKSVKQNGLFLVAFGSWEEGVDEKLEALSAARGDFERDGIAVRLLSMDGPRDEAYVKALTASMGFGRTSGRADRATRVLIEMACQLSQQQYNDLPYPLGFLFDGAGRLCTVQVGELDLDETRRHALAIGASPETRFNTPLTGGYWIREPSRDLAHVAELLRGRGEAELAAEMQAFEAAR